MNEFKRKGNEYKSCNICSKNKMKTKSDKVLDFDTQNFYDLFFHGFNASNLNEDQYDYFSNLKETWEINKKQMKVDILKLYEWMQYEYRS